MMEQFTYIVVLVLIGAAMGTCFDIYNTIAGAMKWFQILRPVLDLLFWIAAAFAVYKTALALDSGRLRFYVFLLLAVGYALYRGTLRDSVVGSAFRIARLIGSIFAFFGRVLNVLLVYPLGLLWRGVAGVGSSLYVAGCRAEDALFWVLKLLFFRILGSWLIRFPGVANFIQHGHAQWEEFWESASNWLKSRIART